MIKLIAVTGSIGTGKSFLTKCFARLGVPTYSSDDMVHSLYQNNKQLLAEIKAKFPDAIINNKIDRAKLGDIIFADKAKKQSLEHIVYPILSNYREHIIKQHTKDRDQLIVFEIPLLFENNLQHNFDYIITSHCNPIIQKQRVLHRKNMSEVKYQAILKSQMPQQEKVLRSDFAVNTGNAKAYSFREIKRVLFSIR